MGALTALLTAGVDGGTFRLRRATPADLPDIVRLLADDSIGAEREGAEDMAGQWSGRSRGRHLPAQLPTRHFTAGRLGFEASHEGLKLPL